MTGLEGPLKLAKLAVAVVALLSALAIAIAWVAGALAKQLGFTLVDVLVAPLVLIVCAGPGVLIAGMASRSRSWLAIAVPLVLCVGSAFLLEATGITPWHLGKWRDHSGDAGPQLFITLVFLLWPATLVGGLLWLVLNRKRSD